jgi:major membrane immunogen (membrane-anchored lipoprotein)
MSHNIPYLEYLFIGGKFMKEAIQFLRAYADDLRYTISQRSVDVVNFNTSGTPEFKTLNEAISYRQKLLNVIRELEND